ALRVVVLTGQTAGGRDVQRQTLELRSEDERVVAQPGRAPRRAPHRVDVEASGVEHRHADGLTHAGSRQVQVAGQRRRELELVAVVGGQGQGGGATHRQAEDAVVVARDTTG